TRYNAGNRTASTRRKGPDKEIRMDELTVVGRDDDRHMLKRFLAQYDVPAYVRRARDVEDALDRLLSHCRQQREEWLSMVRSRNGLVEALAGTWEALRPWLKDEDQIVILRELHTVLRRQPRFPPRRSYSSWVLRRALGELGASIEHFNGRWHAFLQAI